MPEQTDDRNLLAQAVDRLDRAGDVDGATWLRAAIAERAADQDDAGRVDREPIPSC
ncbi:MAG: hypothetical protein L0K86_25835 [Actinomycetia bacterium]|nr:hypothetical protein [Actinomycetes bacterium]